MKRVFIGHRGVGKTSLLKRHQTYFSMFPHFDLDQEIEKKFQVPIDEIFKTQKEQGFRRIEEEVYQEIRKQNPDHVIALGAGFSVRQIDPGDEVVFVSRDTDADGRIFLDRPRLNLERQPLDESLARYHQRQPVFLARASWIYHLLEGLSETNEVEKSIFQQNERLENAYYTLAYQELDQLSQRIKNFSKIELRTDLVPAGQIQKILRDYPNFNWLVSIRDQNYFDIPEGVEVDCDVEFFKKHQVQSHWMISTHTADLNQALAELKGHESSAHLKLCPVIENFADLRRGFFWQQEDPTRRSFLPRSRDGRWNWYRQLGQFMQKLNFVRGVQFQLDQPSVYQWLSWPKQRPQAWAAVLGNPIYFSRSPAQHEKFFKAQNTLMIGIALTANELKENLQWLQELGLTYAAVTSPLKETAYEISTSQTPETKQLRSVNTLLLQEGQVHGHNTDLAGFTFAIDQLGLLADEKIAVWGGGGTLQMLRTVLPNALCYSSRTGNLRTLVDNQLPSASSRSEPTTLIWAAPRQPDLRWPQFATSLQRIVDLNYVENSLGLEYAQSLKLENKKITYVSGIQMFYEQARQQQIFWSQS